MSELVIFDLDNTLIKGQSQKLLLDYVFEKKLIGPVFYFKVLLWFIFYKIGLVKNPKKIMEYSFSFLKDKKVSEFEEIINNFFEEKLKKCIFKGALNLVQKHKIRGRKILIISNAVDFIPRRVSHFLGVDHSIGTKLEIVNDKFTGKIKGDIIYGKNKVSAIRNFIEEHNFSLNNSYGYSDHISDSPLLEIVDHSFAVNPDKELYKKVKEKNWTVLILSNTKLIKIKHKLCKWLLQKVKDSRRII